MRSSLATTFAVAALALVTTTAALAELRFPFTDRLLRDESLWGDGKAEYAVFDACERRYGALHPAEIRHLLVREDFAADEAVKADNWRDPGTYPVIKLNQISNIPTGSYRYDQGHSAFWRATNAELIKFAHTTNDSCGLTYKQGIRLDGRTWRYRAFTYWQGMSEVDREQRLPANALFYDELPFRLRLLDWDRATLFEAPLVPSTIGSTADTLAPRSAAFAIEKVVDGWRVTIKHTQGTDQLTFDLAAPHPLNRWTRHDGSELTRRHLIRLPYWEFNQPGDERFLAPGATHP
jgi:hypothetical protein